MDHFKADIKCTYCGGDHLSAQHPITLPKPKLECAACFLDRHGGEVNYVRGGTKHICGKPGTAKLCRCATCLPARNSPEPKSIKLEVISDGKGGFMLPLAEGKLKTIDDLFRTLRTVWGEPEEMTIALHLHMPHPPCSHPSDMKLLDGSGRCGICYNAAQRQHG